MHGAAAVRNYLAMNTLFLLLMEMASPIQQPACKYDGKITET